MSSDEDGSLETAAFAGFLTNGFALDWTVAFEATFTAFFSLTVARPRGLEERDGFFFVDAALLVLVVAVRFVVAC